MKMKNIKYIIYGKYNKPRRRHGHKYTKYSMPP